MSDLSAGSLIHRLEADCPAPALTALDACRAICRELDVPLYLVGGTVRDLVLKRPGYDVDLTLEGDAEAIAAALAAATGGRAVTHRRFGTASVSGRGFRIDLARARRETYPHPGALPLVEPATISEDLGRRDFTVNAVALRLTPEPSEVIDPYRGIDDAFSGLVRVMHDRSFQDDATRMLRAVRYATRLEFKIATQTAALIRRDLSFLGTISGPRLRRELALQFGEPAAVAGTRLLQQMGILNAIHPALTLREDVARRWQAALQGPKLAPLDELGFCVVADCHDEGTAASISQWLHLTGRVEHAVQDLVRLSAQSPKLTSMGTTPSDATELLDSYAPAAVWAFAVIEGGEAERVCGQYLAAWRHVRSELRGDDLIALGATAGAALGETLRQLRAARLDGAVTTRDEEIALARSLS